MDKLIKPGRIIFAIGIMALGALQFFARDYILGRPPALSWPAWAVAMPGKLAWAYLSGFLLIIAGLAIIFNIKAGLAAIFTGVMILVYSFLFRHLPAMTDWGNAYKSLALGGGAFIVATSFFKKEGTSPGNSFTKDHLILTGCIFLSLFLIYCGVAHLKFYEFVKDFIPDYIPVRLFWTYFTAVALLAGGIGLIFKRTRKWAAALSGLMIFLWFILLHIPRAIGTPGIATPNDYSEWMGVFESFSFSGILFVLAGISSEK
jgi:uncharacterized membrane protein YphA (DoxX/SURF4 family)